ncbi:MAG TPA: GyrI-like domain-containing protein [Methylocystis sp.]|nr:GyrI-like domain-containing protein [Methylocystis sp.]HXZ16552.1 GyrI-like domain-containing protein [Roseiarcus sp.]
MGLRDTLKKTGGLLEKMASSWGLSLALVLLLAAGGVYVKKRFFTAVPVASAPEQPSEAPGQEQKAEPSTTEAPAESLATQTVAVAARPVLLVKGDGKWEDAAKTLSGAIAKVTAAAGKAGLTSSGRPLVVFTKTDDNGFHYEAMAPLAKAPEAKAKFPDGVESGSSPAGKALKFEHRGSYDEIEATYEAITAYLDEKGLDADNLFIEEYLTDLNAAEDTEVSVDIYVFLK